MRAKIISLFGVKFEYLYIHFSSFKFNEITVDSVIFSKNTQIFLYSKILHKILAKIIRNITYACVILPRLFSMWSTMNQFLD